MTAQQQHAPKKTMWRRLGVGAAIVGGLLAIVSAVALAVINTSATQKALIAWATPQIEDAVGGEVKISEAGGFWPWRVHVGGVVLSNEGQVWASIESARLTWQPLSLIRGKISVRELIIETAEFNGPVPSRQTSDNGEMSLPTIQIDLLRLDPFIYVEPGGQRYGVTVNLNGDISDGRVFLNLDGRTVNGASENIKAEIDWQRGSDVLKLNITASAADSAILGALSGDRLRTVDVSIAGDGQLSNWQGDLGFNAPTHGALTANLQCRCRDDMSLVIDAVTRLGPVIDASLTELIGSEIKSKLTVTRPADNRIDLAVSDLSSDAGVLSGQFSVSLPERDEDSFSLSTNGTVVLSGAMAARAETWTGGPVSWDGSGNWRNGGGITVDRLDLSSARSSVTLIDAGLSAENELAATVTGRLQPDTLAEAVSNLVVSGPVEAEIKVAGPLSAFNVAASINTPSAVLDGRALPAARAKASLDNVPGELDGPVEIDFFDDAGTERSGYLMARLKREEQTVWRLDDIEGAYRGTGITGQVAFDTEASDFSAALRGAVEDLAVLLDDPSFAGAIEFEVSTDGWAAEGMTARLAGTGLSAGEVAVNELSVDVSGRLDAAQFEAEMVGGVLPSMGPVSTLSLSGTVERPDQAFDVRLDKFSAVASGATISLVRPTTLRSSDGAVTLAPMELKWGDTGSIAAEAALLDDRLTAAFKVVDVTLQALAMRLSADFTIDTAAAQPGTGNASVISLIAGVPDIRTDAQARWDGARLSLEMSLIGFGEDAGFGQVDAISGSLPLLWTPQTRTLSTDGELDLNFDYEGPVAPWVSLYPMRKQSVDGMIDGRLSVTGTLNAPKLDGRIRFSDGSYEHVDWGIFLSGVDAEATAASTRDGATFALVFSALENEVDAGAPKALSGTGELRLGADAGLSFDAQLDKAKLLRHEYLGVTASGNLNIAGTFEELLVSGDIEVDELEAQIPPAPPPSVTQLDITPVDESGRPLSKTNGEDGSETADTVIRLAINLSADDRLFVRGRGLDSEWGAALKVLGTAKDPVLDGAANIKRGSFDFAGRQFDLSKGRIAFTPIGGLDPSLDVQAERQVGDVLARLIVSGKASAPTVSFSSSPSLPQDDVTALILFGKPAKQLTALEALQMAQAVAQLSGTGPFGGRSIIDRTRQTLGLDLVDLTLGESGGNAGLTVGKYVSDRVFVSVSQDFSGQESEVAVDVEVTDSISVSTDIDQRGDASLGLNWKRDY